MIATIHGLDPTFRLNGFLIQHRDTYVQRMNDSFHENKVPSFVNLVLPNFFEG